MIPRSLAATARAAGLVFGVFAVILAALTAGVTGCAAAPTPRPGPSAMSERPGLRGSVRPEMGSPQPGEPAPDFELPALAGGTVRLSSLRGAWVELHFTGTWCPYCDAEIAHLGELSVDFAPRNVKVLVVDLQEEPEVWSAYARQRVAPSLIALQDRTGAAAIRFAPPRAQPSFTDRAQVLFDATLVIDPAGVIRVFLLPDTAHFDPSFRGVRVELDRQMRGSTVIAAEPVRRAPGDLLAPDRVVDLSAAVRPPERPEPAEMLVVRLAIAPGYHIVSDHPPDPFSIPTVVRASAEGLEFGAPVYPAATRVGALSVFDGTAEVRLPLHRAPVQAAAPTAIAVYVRYQACTESRCLAPVRKGLTVAPP
jgi:peroxiredoxin